MMEIGSFFEYPGDEYFGESPSERKFLEEAGLFASGRDVFAYLGFLLGRVKMFIPDYFCPHTAAYISKFFDVETYVDTPGEHPRLECIEDGSAVLFVNTFGMHGSARYDTRKIGKNIISIEDHSHAPFSKAARESSADYTMASLRKVLPIGGGAYLKSKRKLGKIAFNGRSDGQDATFFEAARRKAEYLKKGRGDKSLFLDLYGKVERMVEDNTAIRPIGAESRDLLFRLDIRKCQLIRGRNFRLFKRLVSVPLLNGAACDDDSVFNPVILLEGPSARDSLRMKLIEKNIYPPIHWNLGCAGGVSAESKSLSERVLTIPLDYRYSESDVAYVARIVNEFS